MPNWCYTRYAITAKPEQNQSFKNTLDKLNSRKKPLIPNGFGNLWCGIIVKLLGKDWHDVRCRGRILDFELSDETLFLNVESAWSELSELRALFLLTYPDADVYYISEEGGMEIYETNDSEGRYFSSRFIIDSEQDGEEYFDTIEEVAAYVQDLTGLTTEATEESVSSTIADWTEQDPDNRWLCFHEFEYVED